MDWDAGASVARDFLHDMPDTYLAEIASDDGTLPAVAPSGHRPGNGGHLRCASVPTPDWQLACTRDTSPSQGCILLAIVQIHCKSNDAAACC